MIIHLLNLMCVKSSKIKMTKSIKLKNDNYIDSSGIVHGHSTLNNMIISHNNGICRKLRIGNIDANDLVQYGNALIVAEQVTKNFPATGITQHYYVIQLVYNEIYVVQIAIHVWEVPLRIYVRRKISNAWKEWESVLLS